MEQVITPTCDDIMDEQLDLVERRVDDGWRHGCYISEVYHRVEDDTYWIVNYRRSANYETNELHEGYAHIMRVMPITEMKSVTTYVKFTPKALNIDE